MDVHLSYCREAAKTVAKRHGIRQAPVDVEAIAVAMGMRVERADLGDADARMWREGDGWVIELNKQRSRTNQRFSVGHEVGHVVLGHDGCGADVDREREANTFSAELLMPLTLVKVALGKGRALGELAQVFEVSKEAMRIKLDEHHLLLKLTSFD